MAHGCHRAVGRSYTEADIDHIEISVDLKRSQTSAPGVMVYLQFLGLDRASFVLTASVFRSSGKPIW
jgi:hypothetical protein